MRSEEHTSELQSHVNLVCRLLLECSVSHIDLHSFPTRRSSDLISALMVEAACVLYFVLAAVSSYTASSASSANATVACCGSISFLMLILVSFTMLICKRCGWHGYCECTCYHDSGYCRNQYY